MKMNKLMLITVGVITLTGSVGLVGCSSSDDIAEDVNPTYNPETNEVTTQFVLNVEAAPNQFTRQSSTTVQRNSNFRGMQDAKLIALSTGNSSWLAPFAGNSQGDATASPAVAAYSVNKTFNLGTLYGSSAVTASDNNTSSSRRVLELAMPIGTDAMLVYARAIPGSDVEESGKVTMDIKEVPENSTIDLVARIEGKSTEYEQACALGAAVINRILSAEVSGLKAGDFTHNGYTNADSIFALTWKGIAKDYKDGVHLAPLAEILAKAYASLATAPTDTTTSPSELRAGSGSALFSIAQSLYTTATSVFGATATDDAEANAQRLAIEIRNRVGNYFNVDTNGNLTEWKSIGNATETGSIIYNLVAAGVVTSDNWSSSFGQVKTGDLKNLPTAFGLPVGAALLYMDDNGKFTYKNPSTSLLDQSKTTKASNYMYPAELLYFDNSALRVNDSEVKAENYPNGVTPWDTEGTWTNNGWTSGTTGGAVTSTTRSVAVKNNINYGVAMLQTKVALDGTTFSDNRHAIVTSEENQTLTLDDVKKFKLTGILIGGQNHQLGWNYLPKANNATDWDYIIFDNKIAGTGAIPTPEGEANYTLVFDNYHVGTNGGTQTDQTDVLVALEFENESKDFYGKGNMVRYGGKFYLVGKLELGSNKITETDTSSNWPKYYAIPPYTDGATNKISRVFIQDFMTTATFKIGENSLKSALVTVPDLRSSQTSLGLSVDLNWQTGLNFETVLGSN